MNRFSKGYEIWVRSFLGHDTGCMMGEYRGMPDEAVHICLA